MKRIKLLLSISVIVLFQVANLLAQVDSVIVESSTELSKKSDYKKKSKYKYLDVNFREEKTLFKLGIAPFNLSSHSSDDYTGTIEGLLGVEKKLIPSLSFIFENKLNYTGTQRYYRAWHYTTDIGLRYYYSIKRNIAESVGANNFHSNYISVKFEHFAHYSSITTREVINWIEYKTKETKWIYNPYISISWGLQRRFGNWAFIDAGPYVNYNANTKFGLGINMVLGLGFGI